MRRWIRQEPKSHNCGPIAVAVITGVPLEKVYEVIGKKGNTSTKDVARGLRKLGYSCPRRLQREPRPELGIAHLRYKGERRSHWVVVDGDKIWDGIYGNSKGNVNWPDGARMTSYLPVLKKS